MSHSQRIRRRRRRSGPRNKLLLGLLVIVAAIGIAGASLVGWVVNVAASAPPLNSLKPRAVGANTEVLAADGTRLGFLQADDLSQPAKGSELPKVLKQATVAIEDQRFYEHSGVDFEGVVRAAVKNFVSHKTVQGGSTITMQLVRNLYTGEKVREGIAGYKRKIREAKLAEDLEDEHSKTWILNKYLNTVPYGTVGGQTAVGAAAAARIYFDKPVSELTLRQAALLAGLPQAPSAYSPILHAKAAARRRNEVLDKMADLGMIDRDLAERTKDKGLGIHQGQYFRRKREAFVFDYVKQELIKEYGPKVALSGLKVHTTIDLKKQEQARTAIATQMGDAGPSSAVVTIDPKNGHILAMASTAKYTDSQFNLAANGHRQPGSAFKVMALMTALREGVDPDSTYYTSRSPTHIDEPQICGAPFDIKTYGGVGAGRLSLRQATLKSDNSVYIQLAVDLGPDKIVETAHDLGIKTKLNGYCAETLGGLKLGVSPLEMADAYATIADGGWRNRPTIITKVDFPDGHSELPRRWRVHRTKVFSDGVTAKAADILQQNIQAGTGTAANIGCPAGGKTGTTDNNTDAWFVGFTPRLATAVWVGYPNDRTFMNYQFYGGPVDGGTFPARIWGAYMKEARGHYCGSFPAPKHPFQSQPFSGKYSQEPASGGPDDTTDGTSTDGTTTPDGTTTTPDSPTPDSTGNGDQQGFDPDKYESPPQGDPGNGGSDGTGGATPP